MNLNLIDILQPFADAAARFDLHATEKLENGMGSTSPTASPGLGIQRQHLDAARAALEALRRGAPPPRSTPEGARRYIGTKAIFARPMTRGEYNDYRDWPPPPEEDQSKPGYLVEYLDGGTANDPRHAGYITWSPADVFEMAYQPTDGMTFGMALEALQLGHRVRRAGWNGKGMWLSLSSPTVMHVPAAQFWSPHNRDFAIASGGHAPVLPAITMKTATGEILMGWLASQTDMLSRDWEILDDGAELQCPPA